MKVAIARLKSVSPLSMSKPIASVKNTDEPHDVFEERTWKERMHVDKKGELFIPPNALKNMLAEVAAYLSESIAGKGNQRYTKNFAAGTMVVKPLLLGIKASTIKPERLFVSAKGERGGRKRVWKNFPLIPEWETECEILIFDPILEARLEKVCEYLRHAGKFIGFLRFRPRNGGYYGRYDVSSFVVDGKEYVEKIN